MGEYSPWAETVLAVEFDPPSALGETYTVAVEVRVEEVLFGSSLTA
jgi:hypothetical protein